MRQSLILAPVEGPANNVKYESDLLGKRQITVRAAQSETEEKNKSIADKSACNQAVGNKEQEQMDTKIH